jgi:hypothetical protein
MAGAEARHLRGLTLVDYSEKDREPPTLLAALERDGAMAPAEFSLRCANFAKRSYQSPTQCIGTLAAILLIESSAPALTGLQRSPERLVPASTYFCEHLRQIGTYQVATFLQAVCVALGVRCARSCPPLVFIGPAHTTKPGSPEARRTFAANLRRLFLPRDWSPYAVYQRGRKIWP